MAIIGIDIGGTKIAVVRASDAGLIEAVRRFPSAGPETSLPRILAAVRELEPGSDPVFGIACGGPLDPGAGLILSPPNLPGWDRVPVVETLERAFGGAAWLMNDANAGALAEWRFGAGRGKRNLVFLTFGTGIGAGIICDGRLYEGADGNAGEIGHVRLTPDGPEGYGKRGSVEGWCSGGGVARRIDDEIAAGRLPADWPHRDARALAAAARGGDARARELLADTGRQLGRSVALLVDLLNPEVVVLGSLFVRAGELFDAAMREELAREALPQNLAACAVVASPLGERLGDHQAVAVAVYHAAGFAAEARRRVDAALGPLAGELAGDDR